MVFQALVAFGFPRNMEEKGKGKWKKKEKILEKRKGNGKERNKTINKKTTTKDKELSKIFIVCSCVKIALDMVHVSRKGRKNMVLYAHRDETYLTTPK